MKKTLLLLSIGIYSAISAQAPVQPSRVYRAKMLVPAYYSPKAEQASNVSNAQPTARKQIRTHKATNTSSINKVLFASSYNMFSVLNANCTQVTANTDLSLVAFTHRECLSYTYGSGAYETDYSINAGSNWDTSASAALIDKNWGTRYPNGIILNPKGNSTPSLAYAVTTGPVTNGTAWDSVARSSIRLDGANANKGEVLMYPKTSTSVLNVFSPPQFESVSDDSVVHSVMNAWTLSSTNINYAFYGAVVNKGAWSGTSHSVTWTQKVLKPHFASSDGPSAPADSDAELSDVVMAWSQDGATGYVVFFGNLDSTGYNYSSLQPVVYKSIDHGNTWNMMPLYNFANLSTLTRFLLPTLDNSSVKLPFWDINGDSNYYAGHGVDVTVDMNNNLHIFGAIESGAIDSPDSGGYMFNPATPGATGRYIYDVYTTTPSGGWKADLLDSLHARGVDPTNTPWTSTANGALTWGARIQATRTTDGSKVFCTWLDDNYGDQEIILPDITSIGIDVATGLKTAPTQFTTDGDNFFVCVSDIATPNGSCWDIPSVVAYDPAPTDGTTPVYFVYVQGIELCNFILTDAPQVINSSPAGFSISANYPNPFSNNTRFDVNLANESAVGVEVYNLVGAKVMTLPTQSFAAGKHTITINGFGLSSGVYFYKVTANNRTITQKMIVQ